MEFIDEDPREYTDEEINQLAEWLQDLTIKQLFFIRDSFEHHKQLAAESYGFSYVH